MSLDFSLSAEHLAVRETVQRLCRKELAGLVYHGAWRVDQGTLDAATAAKVKLVASEAAVAVSEAAIRIHGGASIMREVPVGRIHRDALVYVIGEGTSDTQRNIIASDLGFKT